MSVEYIEQTGTVIVTFTVEEYNHYLYCKDFVWRQKENSRKYVAKVKAQKLEEKERREKLEKELEMFENMKLHYEKEKLLASQQEIKLPIIRPLIQARTPPRVGRPRLQVPGMIG